MFTSDLLTRRAISSGRGLRLKVAAAYRHVSQHASYRIGRPLLALLILGALNAQAIELGQSVQLIRDNDLRSRPFSSAESLGKLPTGTIAIYKGQQQKNFFLVEVELEDGQHLEGWVEKTAVEVDNTIPAAPVSSSTKASGPTRIRIPEDEAMLLRRESTFLYGAHAGGNYSILEMENTTISFAGIGINVGAHLGIFLSPKMPLRFELTYTQMNGTNAASSLLASFSYLDIAIVPSYQFSKDFEIFAGLQYSFGLGLGDIPTGVAVNSAQDISTLGLQAGAAYSISLGSNTSFMIKGRYSVSFLRYPVANQSFGILGAIEVRG